MLSNLYRDARERREWEVVRQGCITRSNWSVGRMQVSRLHCGPGTSLTTTYTATGLARSESPDTHRLPAVVGLHVSTQLGCFAFPHTAVISLSAIFQPTLVLSL